MKTFKEWIEETKLKEAIIVGPPPKNHPDYNIWGASLGLKTEKKDEETQMSFKQFINQIWYHGTLASNIPSIKQKGLLVSHNTNWGGDLGKASVGKIFLAKTIKHASYYIEIIFRQKLENDSISSIPIMLRIHASNISQDTEDRQSGFTTQNIPPEAIEVWWHGKWNSIKTTEIDGDMTIGWDEDQQCFVDWEHECVGTNASNINLNGIIP